MTRYEQGFMRKCAEYGVDGRGLLKQALLGVNKFTLANYGPEVAAGALLGGGIGALTSKKKRVRNALIGAIAGGAAGGGVRYAISGGDISRGNKLYKDIQDLKHGKPKIIQTPFGPLSARYDAETDPFRKQLRVPYSNAGSYFRDDSGLE